MTGVFDPELVFRFWSGFEELSAVPRGDHPVFGSLNNEDGRFVDVGNFVDVIEFITPENGKLSYGTVEGEERSFEDDPCDRKVCGEFYSGAAADGLAVEDDLGRQCIEVLGKIAVGLFDGGIDIFFVRRTLAGSVAWVIVSKDGEPCIVVFLKEFLQVTDVCGVTVAE